MSIFLDIDKARSVFRLLFSYSLDSCSTDSVAEQFQDAIHEITQGVQVPREALAKLRMIHAEVLAQPQPVALLAAQVAEHFAHKREVLLDILRIILRISNDDGMFCTKDREGVRDVVLQFGLSDRELARLTLDERAILAYCVDHGYTMDSSGSLDAHFETLECTPEMTLEEIRRQYRKLVMEFHPDRSTVRGDKTDCRGHFERIQAAYQAIRENFAV